MGTGSLGDMGWGEHLSELRKIEPFDGAKEDRVSRVRKEPELRREREQPKPRKEVKKAPLRALGSVDHLRAEAVLPPSNGETPWPSRCTDLGNAGRLVSMFGAVLRFSPELKGWLFWDGSVWRMDETQRIFEFARRTIESIWAESRNSNIPKKRRKALAEWATKSERRAAINAMVELAQHEVGIPIKTDQLDLHDWDFGVPNGVIDLRTGGLRPHDSSRFSTQSSPVRYEPGAVCPTWVDFIDYVLGGDKELISFVQRAVGYSLTGVTREHCLMILHGSGRNGKSTFLETLRAVLGGYSRSAQFTTFLENKGEAGPRNDLARLRGARFVTAIESDHSRKLAESVVKQITSDDTITARFLYREPFEFKPRLKLWLAANHLPQITGLDEGIWRRVRLVPFKVRIPDDKVDMSLSEKLKAEYPGILNWALDGCRMWQESGLGLPSAVETATEAYKGCMDALGEFVEEDCVVSEYETCSAKVLYSRYVSYATEANERPLTKRTFGTRLRERGLKTIKRGGMMHWIGIGPKPRSSAAF